MATWPPPGLIGLAVRLPALAERRQQSAHAAGADLVAHLLQRDSQLVVALRHPQQWSHRTPERYWLDDPPQILNESSIPERQMSPAATLASHPSLRQRCGVEILQAATDRRACEPRDLMDRRQAAPSRRTYLSGCEHPLTAFIELRSNRIPAFANRLRVDHADPHTAESSQQESRHPESHHRMAPGHKPIHLFCRMSLSMHDREASAVCRCRSNSPWSPVARQAA